MVYQASLKSTCEASKAREIDDYLALISSSAQIVVPTYSIVSGFVAVKDPRSTLNG